MPGAWRGGGAGGHALWPMGRAAPGGTKCVLRSAVGGMPAGSGLPLRWYIQAGADGADAIVIVLLGCRLGPHQPPTARAWCWAMRRGRTAAAPAPCTSACWVRRRAHSAPVARRVNPSRHARGAGGGTAAAGHRLQRLNASQGGGAEGGNTLSAAVAAAHVRGGRRWRRRTRTCSCNHRGQLSAGWGPQRQRGMPAVAAPRRVAVRGGGGGHCPTVSSLPMRH